MLKDYLKHPAAMVLILVMLIIGGMYSYTQLSVDLFPDLNYPLVNIITHYEGGSSKDIETLVTRPIETQMRSLQDVRRISSESRPGLSSVTVEFNWGVSSKDARSLVSQALSTALPNLPGGARPVIENLGSALQNIVKYGIIYGKDSAPGSLKNLFELKIANYLKTVPGVNRVEVDGGKDKAYMIYPDQRKLWQNGLDYSAIANKVTANNKQVMAGFMSAYHEDFAITGKGMIPDINALGHVGLNTSPLYLKDVARVVAGYLPKRYAIYVNGKPGMVMTIYKNAHANTIAVVAGIDQALESVKNLLPAGVKITKVYDQSKVIKDSAVSLRDDILIGIILVAVMMILFLSNLRNSLVVALSVPVIAIVTLIYMDFLGYSLNMITLGAMAVAVGMVVDDSIIIIENIIRHREMGKDAFTAAIDGMKEIATADASGTFTTVAAFIPFLFLSGLGGRFTGPFGAVMSIMLLLSLVISLSIIPVYMAHQQKIAFKKPLAQPFVEWMIAINHRILSRFVRHPKTIIGSSFVVLALTGFILAYLPVSFIPKVDEGAILLEYHLPPGTSLGESNKIGMELEQIALKHPAVEAVYRRTGSEGGTFQIEPVSQGELTIKLKDKRNVSIFEVMKQLRRQSNKIPGIITIYHQVTAEKMDEAMSGLPSTFAVTLYGEDYDTLGKLATEIEKAADGMPAIAAVVNNAKFKVPQLLIGPKRESLTHYGVDAVQMLEEVRYHIGGEIIGNMIKHQTIIPIFLRDAKGKDMTIDQIRHLLIKTALGYVPLERLAEVKIAGGTGTIEHVNLQRVVTLPMEIDGSIPRVRSTLMQKISAMGLPQGYFAKFGGEYENLIDMVKSFVLYGLIAVLLIYIIITIHLGNARDPLAILFTLPLPFAGAFVAMGITRAEVNLSFIIGLITLLGVGINHGIVLLHFINRYRDEGMDIIPAIEKAAEVRTRPILLTVLTAMIALFPIALGIGIGSQIQQSLAISVIGGLLASIFFTLNVLPLLYGMLHQQQEK